MSKENVKRDLKYMLKSYGIWHVDEVDHNYEKTLILQVMNMQDYELLDEVHITDDRITTTDFSWYSDGYLYNLCPEDLIQYANPFFKYIFDKKVT